MEHSYGKCHPCGCFGGRQSVHPPRGEKKKRKKEEEKEARRGRESPTNRAWFFLRPPPQRGKKRGGGGGSGTWRGGCAGEHDGKRHHTLTSILHLHSLLFSLGGGKKRGREGRRGEEKKEGLEKRGKFYTCAFLV